MLSAVSGSKVISMIDMEASSSWAGRPNKVFLLRLFLAGVACNVSSNRGVAAADAATDFDALSRSLRNLWFSRRSCANSASRLPFPCRTSSMAALSRDSNSLLSPSSPKIQSGKASAGWTSSKAPIKSLLAALSPSCSERRASPSLSKGSKRSKRASSSSSSSSCSRSSTLRPATPTAPGPEFMLSTAAGPRPPSWTSSE
mmetsp:Transcript_44551/g.125844  ORF Transcript_44551/g.125844 Transcript_44551/m.125844 type:complete len:200 (-) Transcript_44551:319-918(-)